MFVVRDFRRDGVRGELLEHDVDVDEGVAAAVDQHDGCLDVAGGEFGDFGVFAYAAEGQDLLDVVVVHLEGFGADNLEPVDDGFGAGEGVEVWVGGKFLAGGYVARVPAEEEGEAHVDGADEDGGVED